MLTLQLPTDFGGFIFVYVGQLVMTNLGYGLVKLSNVKFGLDKFCLITTSFPNYISQCRDRLDKITLC